jgi:hypothetical protein
MIVKILPVFGIVNLEIYSLLQQVDLGVYERE